jgi:hypothetical protein
MLSPSRHGEHRSPNVLRSPNAAVIVSSSAATVSSETGPDELVESDAIVGIDVTVGDGVESDAVGRGLGAGGRGGGGGVPPSPPFHITAMSGARRLPAVDGVIDALQQSTPTMTDKRDDARVMMTLCTKSQRGKCCNQSMFARTYKHHCDDDGHLIIPYLRFRL